MLAVAAVTAELAAVPAAVSAMLAAEVRGVPVTTPRHPDTQRGVEIGRASPLSPLGNPLFPA